ncbi:hypothetical protein [Peribacillus asahii]|nr:hypothetical protein [Peribacillus asahii]
MTFKKPDYTDINLYPDHITKRAKAWHIMIKIGVHEYGLEI